MKWRKKTRKYLQKLDNYKIVDLATGTGDQILALKDLPAEFVGIDISKEMLKVAKEKLSNDNRIELMLGSALDIPLDKEVADVVTMSFGIRNVSDPNVCLSEIKRVLKTGGRALIMEFSKPKNTLLRHASSLYINKIVPWLGSRVSKSAYKYLPETIEDFPCGDEFIKMMEANGLINCRQILLNFGTVTLYIGEKK